MFEFKRVSSKYALPQPQRYQSLPHSSKQLISNLLKLHGLRTLRKTTGGVPLSSHFGTRPSTFRPARSVDGFAIATFVPPCRNSPPPYTIKSTGAPRLSCLRD